MEPDVLALDEVLEIHLDHVSRYSGEACLRDLGLLESALATAFGKFWRRMARR